MLYFRKCDYFARNRHDCSAVTTIYESELRRNYVAFAIPDQYSQSAQ